MAPDPVTETAVETQGIAGQILAAVPLLELGGPVIWAITALSVLTVAVILWKTWRLALAGVWRRRRAERAVAAWRAGRHREALAEARGGSGLRAKVARTAMTAMAAAPSASAGREETERVAKRLLTEASAGLRLLELIATIAPLLGLLGTVLGMIEAFQALQEQGARADPAALAGGIWEALLTTAAGMAVAIPASMALAWFDGIVERVRLDMEDLATRIFLAYQPPAARGD